jgi:3-methylcrotonyl-CoA carboxylase alpha subunit
MSEKTITIGGEQNDLLVEHAGPRFRSGELEIELLTARDGDAEIRIAGRTFTVPYVISGTRIGFWFDGEIYDVEVTEKGARAKAKQRDHSLAAPMPGVVRKIFVKTGDVIDRGAPLVVLEAMKMEHQITAPRAGRVTAVNCSEGELVQPGVELVELSDDSPS